MMQRWDVINHLIKKNGYRNYLEIGYYKGWSFDRVECRWKMAVDPNPCKTPEQELYSGGYQIIRGTAGDVIGNAPISYPQAEGGTIVKSTSDDFFAAMAPFGNKYDIIFIDGLHEANQVLRDVHNASKHLKVGGTIVLHDCNPPLYEHTTTGIHGCWTGDVYKAAQVLKMVDKSFEDDTPHDFYVIDTDWGVGILSPKEEVSLSSITNVGTDWWKRLEGNRKEVLNLISVEEFLKREPINQVA